MRLSNIALAVSAQYGGLFKPSSLFTTGVNGAWYDPSDFSTMFQDAAGTTPVTAVGQPVGLMLDKSKGLVLGSEQFPNYDFTNWTSAGGVTSKTANSFTTTSGGGVIKSLPGGAGKTYQIRIAGTTSQNLQVRNGNTSEGAYIITPSTFDVTITSPACFATVSSFYLSLIGAGAVTITTLSVRELPGNHAFNSSGNSANFPVFSARYNLLTATGTLSTQTVTTQATNYTLTFSGVGAVTLSGTATGVYTAGTYTFNATVGSLIVTVAGMVSNADLRPTNDALNQPAYQRVNTASDYDTVGFKPYLSFNGVNQWLQTNSIDFTYGDKMFVSAGVRKISDATTCVVTELSNSFGNSGIFDIFAPVAAGGATYTFGSGGTSAVAIGSPAAYASPTTNIVSGIGNISAPSAILRVNGSRVAQSTSSQGTGNYGNYPLYIGARAGTSLFFNGRLYGLVVAGKQASASEIANTESWLNQKTGAY